MLPSTDGETLAAAAIMAVAGLFVGYLGYRIRYRGYVRLIAGYDADRVTDDDGLGGLVGGVTLALGAVHVALGVALLYVPPDLAFWTVYVGAMVLGLAVVQWRGRAHTA